MCNVRYDPLAWHEEVVPLPDIRSIPELENSGCSTSHELKNDWRNFNARTDDCNDDRSAEPGRR